MSCQLVEGMIVGLNVTPSLFITHDPTFAIALSHAYCNHSARFSPKYDWLFFVTPVSTPVDTSCLPTHAICSMIYI